MRDTGAISVIVPGYVLIVDQELLPRLDGACSSIYQAPIFEVEAYHNRSSRAGS
jgi:hypothetical protein